MTPLALKPEFSAFTSDGVYFQQNQSAVAVVVVIDNALVADVGPKKAAELMADVASETVQARALEGLTR